MRDPSKVIPKEAVPLKNGACAAAWTAIATACIFRHYKAIQACLLESAEPMEDILDKILMFEYGEENLAKCQEAFKLWTDAICYYTPTSADLGGVGRVGPAYPLSLFYTYKLPDKEESMFGAQIVSHNYNDSDGVGDLSAKPRASMLNLRIHEETRSLLKKEAVNAESAVPLINADSRLGWVPSMLYLCDRERLDLKQQIRYVLDKEMAWICTDSREWYQITTKS